MAKEKRKVTVTCSLDGCNNTKEVYLSAYKEDRVYYCCREHYKIGQRKVNEYIIHENYAEIVINSSKYGQFKTKIDIEDIEKCKQYYWSVIYGRSTKGFYVHAHSRDDNDKMVRLHRFVTNCPQDKVVDHRNHDTLDNRKCNLFVCSCSENMENRLYNPSNKLGYRNVYRATGTDKYRVQIKKGGKFFTPNKLFDTPEEANEVAIKMRNEIFTNNVLDRINKEENND